MHKHTCNYAMLSPDKGMHGPQWPVLLVTCRITSNYSCPHMWPNIGKPALSWQTLKLSCWHDIIKKLNLSNDDCVVSIRLSVGEIEAETSGTSNNKRCEKNAIIDYFQYFRSRPFHVKRSHPCSLWPCLQMAAEKRLMLGGASYAVILLWCWKSMDKARINRHV